MSIESGKQYSISELFSGDKRIIIPDLQRDYCWGNTKKNLATNFLHSLNGLFEQGDGLYKQVSLGLIYAYETPRNFVNIADGQQRITTLYLLLCVIYRIINSDKNDYNISLVQELKDFLILDSDKTVWEPRLRYEVRESTVYFIKAFLNNEIKENKSESFDNLKKASWFRDEYKTDPSIASMLETISSFYKELSKENGKEQYLSDFAYFLLGITPVAVKDKLEDFIINEDSEIRVKLPKDFKSISRLYKGNSGICFVYFDVENRDFGEKMYVIINTRGAPMEPNEHLKPLLIGALEQSKQVVWTEKWEKWQDFFWQNKISSEASADNGFNEFLDWYRQIKQKVERKYTDKTTDNNKPKSILDDFKEIFPDKVADALQELEFYIENLKKLLGWTVDKGNSFRQIFRQINKDFENLRSLTDQQIRLVVVPLLSFMAKISGKQEDVYRFLRRLRKNYFDNQRNYRKHNHVKWQDILRIIENSDTPQKVFENSEVWKWVENKVNYSPVFYNLEERLKVKLFSNNTDQQKETLWKWEDHDDFAGDITPLLQMCIYEQTNKLEFNKNIDLNNKQHVSVSDINEYYNIYVSFLTNNQAFYGHHVYSLYNVLALPFMFWYNETNQWWRNLKILYWHQIPDLYNIWKEIKQRRIIKNKEEVKNLLMDIIGFQLKKIAENKFDYRFLDYTNHKTEQFKLVDIIINDQFYQLFTDKKSLYFVLLLLQILDDLCKGKETKIKVDCTTLNFSKININEKDSDLGNWCTWSRGKGGHNIKSETGNWSDNEEPQWNKNKLKRKMINFKFYESVLDNPPKRNNEEYKKILSKIFLD